MGTRQRREGRGSIAPKRIIGPPWKTWGKQGPPKKRQAKPSQAKPSQVLSAARPLAFSAPATLTAAS